MFKKNENGQAAVILVIAIVVLLAFAALAIDAGNAYNARREAQNAVDSSALAGSRQLVLECGVAAPSEANISAQALQMVKANLSSYNTVKFNYIMENSTAKYEVGSVGFVPCACGSRAIGVEAIVDRSAPAFLASFLGRSTLDVHAEARAKYGTVETVSSNLYPFTRRMPTGDPNDPLYHEGQVVQLRILDDADTLPGNFGWLTWDGQNNTPALADSLTPPGNSQIYYNPGTPANNWTANMNDHEINIGDWVQGAPGNKNANDVRGWLDWHIQHKTAMIIPLYDAVAGQGSHSNYKVAGFAAWELQSYDFTGNDKFMTGKFLRWVTSAEIVPPTCGAEGSVYTVKLAP